MVVCDYLNGSLPESRAKQMTPRAHISTGGPLIRGRGRGKGSNRLVTVCLLVMRVRVSGSSY